MNKNIVAALTHNEYKDVLLKIKCLKYLVTWIQSKDHRIETYETNKIFLSFYDGTIYIQKNGYDRLVLVIKVNNKRSSYLNNH